MKVRMANPIVQREFVGLFRQPRTVALPCGLAAALAVLVTLRWPTDARMTLSGSRSQEVFRLLAYGLAGALLLLLPVFPATSIVREKKQGTLALLLNTPLGPFRIFAGKMLAILAMVAVMLTLTVASAAACYALGGVSLGSDLLGMYVILALAAIQYTALGLLVSTYAASTDAAVRWTYAWVLLLSVVALAPHYFLIGAGGVLAEVVAWLRCSSPLAAMMVHLGAADVGGRGVASNADVFWQFVGLSLGSALGLSLWTIYRLNSTLFDQA